MIGGALVLLLLQHESTFVKTCIHKQVAIYFICTSGLSYTTFVYKAAAVDHPSEGAISLDAARELLATTAAAGRNFPSSELVESYAPLVRSLILDRLLTLEEAACASESSPMSLISICCISIQTLKVNYMINVTNTGKLDADDVVLGFLVPPGAGVDGHGARF
jgi:hypothetical protein